MYLEALRDGSIDLLPEYNGSLLVELDGEADASDSHAVHEQLGEILEPEDITTLNASPAEKPIRSSKFLTLRKNTT